MNVTDKQLTDAEVVGRFEVAPAAIASELLRRAAPAGAVELALEAGWLEDYL